LFSPIIGLSLEKIGRKNSIIIGFFLVVSYQVNINADFEKQLRFFIFKSINFYFLIDFGSNDSVNNFFGSG
jgi:hypothetical protein